MMRLNNKGYMLVEIIMASVLAFGIAYFLLELTINLKNKNDDLLVETLVETDKGIITNMIMSDIYGGNGNFSCSDIVLSGNKFEYKGKKMFLNEYTKFGSLDCSNNDASIDIKIPLDVTILGEDYIEIKYKK